jgi:hypothetical protein
MFLTPKNRWASKVQRAENNIGNEQVDMTVYNGWKIGMAGPLWLVAKAKVAGFSVDDCRTTYRSSWGYIEDHYLKVPDSAPKGLYAGGPGIALALIEGIKSGLLQLDADTITKLHQCFSQSSGQFDLSAGWAGEGIALLHCANYLEDLFFQKSLSVCVENIIKNQQPNGSWAPSGNMAKKNKILSGFDKGVPGIVWFLLSYIQRYPDDFAKKAALKGLDWLIGKSIKREGACSWTVTTDSRIIDRWSIATGIPGILLVFIKAFEVMNEPLYREIAEHSFQKIPPRLAFMDFTLGYGLAGIGELYLEAFRVFNNEEWKKRADWIAALIINCFQPVGQNAGYWMAQTSHMETAELFSGNSGILHFLLGCLDPSKIKHPLAADITLYPKE